MQIGINQAVYKQGRLVACEGKVGSRGVAEWDQMGHNINL